MKGRSARIEWKPVFLLTALFALVLAEPAHAQAALEPVENVLTYFAQLITGPIGRLIGIIAVAGAGIMTIAGRMEAKTLLFIFIGVALIFGSALIVDTIGDTFGGPSAGLGGDS